MSKTTVDLGKHGTATLRDPEDVTEKARRLVQRCNLAAQAFVEELKARGEIPADLDSDEAQGDTELAAKIGRIVVVEHPEFMENQQDAVILAFVEDWPFSQPRTMEGVQEIPSSAYDALKAACESLVPLLNANYQAPTPVEAGNTPFDS